MAKFKVITPFNFYKQGEIVGDTECSKYGPQYFERLPEDSNDTTPEQNDEAANDTNETPAADLETTGEVITEPESSEEPKAPAETTEPEKPKAKKRR